MLVAGTSSSGYFTCAEGPAAKELLAEVLRRCVIAELLELELMINYNARSG